MISTVTTVKVQESVHIPSGDGFLVRTVIKVQMRESKVFPKLANLIIF